MTPQEALQTFGNTISCQYYVNGDYQTATFTYNSVWSSAYGDHSNGAWTYEGSQFLEYTCNISPDVNPQYITFDIQPMYSIFDTEQIHTVICLSTGSQNSVSMIYQSPSWDWVFDGQTYHLENSAEGDISGQFAYIRSDGQGFTFVPADFSSPRLASGYSYRAVFSGNVANYPCRLLIGIPYVSTGASGSEGTFTTASSGGNTNINVSVDMSETNEKIDESNGFLSSIVSWITDFFSNLGSFFVRLFVPADGFIDNWKEDLAEAIADTFSPVDTVNDTLDRLKQAFDIAGEGSINAIEFPAISIPGTSFSTPAVSVPLRPMSDSSIYDRIAKFIDIVATIAVFNMLLNKFKAFLVGEKVVEVENVD